MTTNHNEPQRIDRLITHGVARCRIDPSTLTAAAALTQVIDLNTEAARDGGSPFPANARPMFAWVNVLTPISGPAVASCLVKVGDAGADDEQLIDVSVFTGAAGILPKSGAYALGSFELAYLPIVTLTATGANLDVVDAGLLEVCISYQAINTDSVTR
jgi:hypothetical protein